MFFLSCICLINISNAQDTETLNTKAENTGLCHGALVEAGLAGEMNDYNKYIHLTDKYFNETKKYCGEDMKLTEACHKKLSMPTRIFWGATTLAMKNLRSPAPTNLLKNSPPGNLPLTRGMFILAYCR